MKRGTYVRTEEWKKRAVEILHKPSVNLKRANSRRGKSRLAVTKERISFSMQGKRQYEMTPEIREKIRLGRIRYWDTVGRNPIKRYIHSTKTAPYIKWRLDVFTRDNFTCQWTGQRNVHLEAHHIKSWAKFPELRFVVSNGLTLSQEPHKLANKIQQRLEKNYAT